MKTTNYYNTFIEIAEDCPVKEGNIPPLRGERKTAARIQYEMISQHRYNYSSDDVIFEVFAQKNNIPKNNRAKEREKFFSKGRPCMRASALTKRYGWGVHSDAKGKIAIYGVESVEYETFANDQNLNHLKAMRTGRA